MSKRLAGMFTGLVAALIFAAIAFAATPTPTPEPAPRLTYSKIAGPDVDVGGLISFTISVTNSGNANSGSQTAQDTLPGALDWFIGADTWGCALSPSSTVGRTVLRCEPAIAVARHLNEAEDDFINGSVSVTVVAQAQTCGVFANFAVIDGAVPVSAFATVRCPVTPTPVPTATATPAPPTPTPTPIATATAPSPTALPATEEPTIAPRPQVTPLPPKTGSGVADDTKSTWPMFALGASFVVLLVLLALPLAVRRRGKP